MKYRGLSYFVTVWILTANTLVRFLTICFGVAAYWFVSIIELILHVLIFKDNENKARSLKEDSNKRILMTSICH